MRVLIADDDRMMCVLLKKALRKWGHDVVVCHDGMEAWDTLQGTDPPRLAILDWLMPGMEGPEICKRLRRQETNCYTHILLLSARSERSDILEGKGTQFDPDVVEAMEQHAEEFRLIAAGDAQEAVCA